MKRLLLTPIFKCFKKSAFFSSLNQNTCPVYDAEEIQKHAAAGPSPPRPTPAARAAPPP